MLADIRGPGAITHIWMAQSNHYRECLLKITWDNARSPSVLVPLGDFFGLGHGMVNSFQSLFFTASTRGNNQFNQGCALNAYVPMPFKERAVVELVNQSREVHRQYFYIDYETFAMPQNDFGYSTRSFAGPTHLAAGDMKSMLTHRKPISSTRKNSPGKIIMSSWKQKGVGIISAAT